MYTIFFQKKPVKIPNFDLRETPILIGTFRNSTFNSTVILNDLVFHLIFNLTTGLVEITLDYSIFVVKITTASKYTLVRNVFSFLLYLFL